MKTIAVIVAGGDGQRFGGGIPKQYQLIAGRPLLAWTIERFEKAASIDQIVIVAAEDYLLHVNNSIVNPYGFAKVFKIVPGGASRAESVLKGIMALPLSTSFVAVHDAARPLVKPADIDEVTLMAQSHRAAILGRPMADTVKRVREGMIIATIDRVNLYRAETPQVFQYDLIKEAYQKAIESKTEPTDDASAVEALGFMVRLVEPTGPNPKVTVADDLDLAARILEGENK
ncbi:MAG: 2-C-methyl-D-erythritol 4-phosphate cytidylyltransferase [FCB group bacterium]|nr:2-C-methyl-D-erythritol 4-phosphate cytidylyltransferase [FCB group bacterium]